MPGRARFPLLAVLAASFLSLFFVSCGGEVRPAAVAAADVRSGASILPTPVALLKPSSEPAWFEFGSDGFVPIKGPLDSSLSPFDPWPLARRVVGFSSSGSAIAAAVNRVGILTLLEYGGDLRLYRSDLPADACSYTTACVFRRENGAAALLYRDRFFVDPSSAAPDPRVFHLGMGRTELGPAEIPLFAQYPASGSWDIDALELAADGRWLFRASRDGAVSYASGASLDGPSVELSAAAYRAALIPRSRLAVDGALRFALEAAVLDLPEGKAAVAAVVREGAEATESFLISREDDLNVEAALARAAGQVDRAWAYADADRAYLLSGDGSYFAAVSGSSLVSRGRLPTLPDGFTYSGIAAIGGFLAAAWEEQDGWSVGSAGLLIVSAAP